MNEGNTCYLAAVLHVLAYLRYFTSIRPRKPTKKAPKVIHTEHLRSLVAEVKLRGPPLSLHARMPAMAELRVALDRACKGLELVVTSGGGTFKTAQEDPSEALSEVLDFVRRTACLRDAPRAATLKSHLVISRHFWGIQGLAAEDAEGYLAARRCPCGMPLCSRRRRQESALFPMHLPRTTSGTHSVEGLLAMDSSKRQLYECANEDCTQSKSGGRLQWMMKEYWRLDGAEQDVVLLHAARFLHAGNGGQGSRNDCPVKAALYVDMPVRTADGYASTLRYELRGAILQRGGLNAGHITIMLLVDGRWVLYDDRFKYDLGPADGTLGFVAALERLGWTYSRHCYVLVLKRDGSPDHDGSDSEAEEAEDRDAEGSDEADAEAGGARMPDMVEVDDDDDDESTESESETVSGSDSESDSDSDCIVADAAMGGAGAGASAGNGRRGARPASKRARMASPDKGAASHSKRR